MVVRKLHEKDIWSSSLHRLVKSIHRQKPFRRKETNSFDPGPPTLLSKKFGVKTNALKRFPDGVVDVSGTTSCLVMHIKADDASERSSFSVNRESVLHFVCLLIMFLEAEWFITRRRVIYFTERTYVSLPIYPECVSGLAEMAKRAVWFSKKSFAQFMIQVKHFWTDCITCVDCIY